MIVGPDFVNSISENNIDISSAWIFTDVDAYSYDYKEVMLQPISSEAVSLTYLKFKVPVTNIEIRSGNTSTSPLLFAGISYNIEENSGSVVLYHNDLGGLQGGIVGEYYHLSATQYNQLTSGGDTSLHNHSFDRNRSNHTGTQLASTISDFTSASRMLLSATTPIVYSSATGIFSHSTIGSAGTYTKVVTNATGHVTSGSVLTSADIPSLDASKITTGTIDVARIPVLPSQVPQVTTNLASLTTAQQNIITSGTVVTTSDDGWRYVYSGTGSKTASASYVILADISPEWTAIANRPTNVSTWYNDAGYLTNTTGDARYSLIGHNHNGLYLTSTSALNPANVVQTASYRFVTDTEKATWNGKQNAITLGTTAQYFRGDLSLATFPTNLSSFTNGPGYVTSAIGDLRYAPIVHNQVWSTITSVPTASTSTSGVLTSTDWNTFNNKASTAQLANYLPLSGGTLTGPLTGTTAAFSENISEGGVLLSNKYVNYGNTLNDIQTPMYGGYWKICDISPSNYQSHTIQVSNAFYGQQYGINVTIYVQHDAAGPSVDVSYVGRTINSWIGYYFNTTSKVVSLYIYRGSGNSFQQRVVTILSSTNKGLISISTDAATTTPGVVVVEAKIIYASTTQLANYLPLSGGTLTGPLNGTTASFSGSVTSNSVFIAQQTQSGNDAGSGARIALIDPATTAKGWIIQHGQTEDKLQFFHQDNGTWTEKAYLTSAGSFITNNSITSKYSGIDTNYFSTNNTFASWGHKSATALTDYAILQNNVGNTWVGARTTLSLEVSNQGVMSLTSAAATFFKPIIGTTATFSTTAVGGQGGLVQIKAPSLAANNNVSLMVGKSIASQQSGFLAWYQGATDASSYLSLQTYSGASPLEIKSTNFNLSTEGNGTFAGSGAFNGATMLAWGSSFKPIMFGGQACLYTYNNSNGSTPSLVSNFYHDGINPKIIATSTNTNYPRGLVLSSDGTLAYMCSTTSPIAGSIVSDMPTKFSVSKEGNGTFAGSVTAGKGLVKSSAIGFGAFFGTVDTGTLATTVGTIVDETSTQTYYSQKTGGNHSFYINGTQTASIDAGGINGVGNLSIANIGAGGIRLYGETVTGSGSAGTSPILKYGFSTVIANTGYVRFPVSIQGAIVVINGKAYGAPVTSTTAVVQSGTIYQKGAGTATSISCDERRMFIGDGTNWYEV